MRVNIIATGLLMFLINNPVWAEAAPVVDANNSGSSSVSAFNETPNQEFVQRDENAAQDPKAPALLLNKIESLAQEVQELRGKLEVQAHDLKLLNEQQQAFYKDIDERLAKLAGVTVKAESKPPVEPIKKVSNEVKPVVPEPVKENKTENKSPAKDDGLALSDVNPTKTNNQGDGEQSYTAAYQLVKEKQYTQAISAFEAFLIAYPGSSYLANANYWLGELYLMQGHTDQALQAFTRVVKQYPKSSKAVGAQLKIGFAYYDKGQWQAAREALQKVASLYPDTPSAHLAGERLQAMDQQGL